MVLRISKRLLTYVTSKNSAKTTVELPVVKLVTPSFNKPAYDAAYPPSNFLVGYKSISV